MSKATDFPIVYVKNLPYNTSTESLYQLFGEHGAINQIRVSNQEHTGDCFIVYQNLASATKVVKELNGINFNGRYIVLSLYSVDKSKLAEEDYVIRREELERLKEKYQIS
ncbi:uncharacterized protein RJT21DRAFT_86336 [Scheffersomyces amazonensis]|uniref:uncharacterized protein n=1 Tax=Scheffersomyces amazonensis TaxID=1078765 RepID=UPI00315C58A6